MDCEGKPNTNTDILCGVLLYYVVFVQHFSMAPASKGALLNIHYYYYTDEKLLITV